MVERRVWEQRYAEMEAMMAEIRRNTLELQRSTLSTAKQVSEFVAAVNRSRNDKLCDDRSSLDRYSPSSQRVKGSGSESLERSGEDRRFREYLMLRSDDDDETWTETDLWYRSEKENPEDQAIVEPKEEIRESLVHKAIVEDKSTSQFQVPMPNSEIVRSIEPGKVDLGLEKLEHVGGIESLNQDRHRLCVGNEGCLNCFQALGLMNGMTNSSSRAEELMKEESDFVKVNEVKMEKQIVDREMSPTFANLETVTKGMIGSHVVIAFASKQPAISYSPYVEHNLFATMLLRVQSKKKQRKGHKSWMFKFKTCSKSARTNLILLQEKKPNEFEQVMNHTPFSVARFGKYKDCDALLLLLPSDERFQIKHSELLVIVLEWVDTKGGFGMDKKPLHLSLRNRVWDPGGCLENLEVKVSSRREICYRLLDMGWFG